MCFVVLQYEEIKKGGMRSMLREGEMVVLLKTKGGRIVKSASSPPLLLLLAGRCPPLTTGQREG